MKLSTKTQYGTRALLDLAIHQKGNIPVPLKDVAQRQAISLTYLEHIIAPLNSAGIVNTIRGAKGGIVLAKSARNITLKDIVETLEGATSPVDCVNHRQRCSRSGVCATQDIWGDVKEAVDRVLKSTTLQDLADRQAKLESAAEMYFI